MAEPTQPATVAPYEELPTSLPTTEARSTEYHCKAYDLPSTAALIKYLHATEVAPKKNVVEGNQGGPLLIMAWTHQHECNKILPHGCRGNYYGTYDSKPKGINKKTPQNGLSDKRKELKVSDAKLQTH